MDTLKKQQASHRKFINGCEEHEKIYPRIVYCYADLDPCLSRLCRGTEEDSDYYSDEDWLTMRTATIIMTGNWKWPRKSKMTVVNGRY